MTKRTTKEPMATSRPGTTVDQGTTKAEKSTTLPNPQVNSGTKKEKKHTTKHGWLKKLEIIN